MSNNSVAQQTTADLRIADYNYPLPDERIAKHPLAERERCKLLVWDGKQVSDRHFSDVPALWPHNALLVYNNTRVINARLRFTKATGSTIEIFCLEPVAPVDYALMFQATEQCTWRCLVGNSKRWKAGDLTMALTLPDGTAATLRATRGERHGNAWDIHFAWNSAATFATVIEAAGEIPIPPYLNRATEQSDATDYQTVYSHIDGSVAAPTAGLHFTPELLEQCDAAGIARRELTLHVGAGTFQPVKSERIGDHDMHYEFIDVPRQLLVELIEAARPVVAVGTTTVRTLESMYYVGCILHNDPEATDLTVTQWMPYTMAEQPPMAVALQHVVDYLDRHGLNRYVGSTQLMIAPGYTYRVVQGMITNFHQPQSTLLLLVSAFVGDDRWRALYDHALAGDYRFLSYGDACLFLREPVE